MRSNHQLKVESACSVSTGIIFFSNQKPDYAVMAKRDKLGNICCEHIKVDDLQGKKYDINDTFFIIKSRITNLIMIVSLIISMFFFVEAKFNISLKIVLGGFSFAVAFSLFTENISKQSAKFHSAEHKVVNAFNKLNRIPTLDEAKKFSRFNKKCGTNAITHIFLDSTIMFICTFIQNPILGIIISLCSILWISILAKLHLLCWGQFFTTLPPTDMELKLAINGLKEWFELEKEYSKDQNKPKEKFSNKKDTST